MWSLYYCTIIEYNNEDWALLEVYRSMQIPKNMSPDVYSFDAHVYLNFLSQMLTNYL